MCVVAREVSKHPPWSMATSTTTEPGFIWRDHSRGPAGGRSAGNQYRADHQVGALDRFRMV